MIKNKQFAYRHDEVILSQKAFYFPESGGLELWGRGSILVVLIAETNNASALWELKIKSSFFLPQSMFS